MTKQQTLNKQFSLTGVGLHTGRTVTVRVKPAEENTGIVFQRIDLPGAPEIRVCEKMVQKDNRAGRCTIIGQGESAIQTIEHLTGALLGMGVDNARIEIDGPEAPGMDGSALAFVEAIEKAGIAAQEVDRKWIVLKKSICVREGDASIVIAPSEEFKITYVLDYRHPQLASQVVNMTWSAETFKNEIAPARTFCLREEAEALRQAGFGKGADAQNTLVMETDGPLDNVLRFENECARHKVLDLIGDLSVLGRPVLGHVFAIRSGHHLNAQLVKAIAQQEGDVFPAQAASAAAKPMIDINGILATLPHRYPFLLVDRIIEIDEGKRAVGVKNLTFNEPFFQGHFPTRPVMPGVLMIEAMAQVGGLLLKTVEMHRNHIGLFMAINNVKFRRTVGPGDQLVMEVEVVRDRARMAAVHSVGCVDGEVACEADMMFSFLESDYLFGAS